MSDFTKNTSVIITTVLRNSALERLLASFDAWYPNLDRDQIIIADQNEEGDRLSLADMGYRHLVLPYDCGVSYARNRAIEAVVTDKFILMEDDMELRRDTDLQKLADAIECGSCEMAAGTVMMNSEERTPYEGDLEFTDFSSLLFTVAPDGLPEAFAYQVNAVSNFFAGWRGGFCWDGECKMWDERLKAWEHLDFTINLMPLEPAWQIAWVPEVRIGHFPAKPSKYKSLRIARADHYRRITFEKHKIRLYEVAKATDTERWFEGRESWGI